MPKATSLLHKKLNIYLFTIFFLALVFIFLISPSLKAVEFPDTIGNWARTQIAHLNAIGLCSGYEDGCFKPQDGISRAEFTKFLINALGYGEEAARLKEAVSTYQDVESSYWGKAYIQIADELGLALGDGSSFEPEKSISREEAALMLSWVLKSPEELDEFELPFIDSEEISLEARAGLKQVYQEGIINGYDDGSFRPQDQLSRAEATVMIARLMERQGRLFQFNGIVKGAGSRSAQIIVNGKTRDFMLAPGAIICDGTRISDSLQGVINTRISFNVNEEGEIIFAQLHYEDKYTNVHVLQLDDISSPVLAEAGLETETNLGSSTMSTRSESRWAEEPGLSLEIARDITRVDELSSEYGLSGEGVVIAVIDSGIGTRHPDLQKTNSNSPKILDWVNLTEEGRVQIPYSQQQEGEFLPTHLGPVRLPKTKSLSGEYRYGIWREEWIILTQDLDFTGNGLNDDEILVLLVDAKEPGVYDTVFVDSNGNLSLLDEIPLLVYRDHKSSYASFPVSTALPQGFSFVLSDIASDGSEVSFAYDSLGHGTHVAGIAAGQGRIKGIAPNARLMAVKVVDSSGITSIEKIVEGIRYALQHGANVINISLGQYIQDDADWEYYQGLINRMAGDKVVFVASSGNGGPGIASLSTPGDVENIISVGAYMAPELLALDYGEEIRSDVIWSFSSNGPSPNGSWKPDLIAPAAMVSSYPSWKESSYYLDQGTSMAAPMVAGTAALLLEGMWVKGKAVNSHMVKTALREGALTLEGYELIEQGHGLLDALSAWEYLQPSQGLARPQLLETRVGLFDDAKGVYSRSLTPGIATLEAINRGKESVFINWVSNVEWLKPEQEKTQIAAESTRKINLLYKIPEEPGVYTGLLQGLAENMPYNKVEFLNTIIVPIELGKGHEYLDYNSLEAGQCKKYYFSVPAGADTLHIKLKILGTMNKLQGRARIHLNDPQGKQYGISDYAGLALEGQAANREVKIIADKPDSGTWEVVVYSSPALGQYNLKKSDFVLSVELQASQVYEYGFKEPDLIVGCALPLESRKIELLQLNILDGERRPYNGKLLINERLYEVIDGKVKIFPSFKQNDLNLSIQRLPPDQ
jgi:tripeptidyl-peptidase-2